MAVRDIVLYLENEAALRKKSKPVRRITRRVRRLVQDLKDTLNDDPGGIGLVDNLTAKVYARVQRRGYSFNPDADCWIDTVEFQARAQ